MCGGVQTVVKRAPRSLRDGDLNEAEFRSRVLEVWQLPHKCTQHALTEITPLCVDPSELGGSIPPRLIRDNKEESTALPQSQLH